MLHRKCWQATSDPTSDPEKLDFYVTSAEVCRIWPRQKESGAACFAESPQLLAMLRGALNCSVAFHPWWLFVSGVWKTNSDVLQIPLCETSSLRGQTHSLIAYLHPRRIKPPASLQCRWIITHSLESDFSPSLDTHSDKQGQGHFSLKFKICSASPPGISGT